MTNPAPTRRLVVLISGTGSTMRALLDATSAPGYGAQVVGVISDRADAAGLDIAAAAGVPAQVVALADFESRGAWDEALANAIGAFEPDMIVCAGFMRLLGPAVLERFEGTVVNTHPALLPAFPGAHAVRDALAGGAKVTGCTVMLVDAGVDTGPIVAQAAVDVQPGDTEETLHERIKVVERALVADTVGRMARQGWTVAGRTVTVGEREEH